MAARCKRCQQLEQQPQLAVKTVLSIDPADPLAMRETDLCRVHLDEWHQWRLLIFGEGREDLGPMGRL